MNEVALLEDKDSVLLPVRVKPGARANTVEGTRGTALLISVTAAPTEGEANAAVLKLLARQLHCSKSSLSIARGHKMRDKVIRLSGLSIEDARARLAALM
jgi:uncharacterized protein (TIGR00251 family)